MARRGSAAWVSSSLALLTCGALLWPALPARAATRVKLPTEADVIAFAPGAETILYGPRGIETLLPGPVDDDEVVRVAFAPDGTPVEVAVRQRLVVHGLGDFRFKVAGPAQTVEALPDSEAEPGLRKGSVLWQGFSSGTKVLASEMLLFPDQESARLPLRVSLEHTVDGAVPEEPGNGRLSVRVVISNESADPVTLTSAMGEPAELASALDAIAGQLGQGNRPRPGSGGVPAELTVLAGERTVTRPVAASFHVNGRLTFESGTLEGAEVAGGKLVDVAGPPLVFFDGFVGAGESRTFEVSLSGTARSLGRPIVDLVARPAPPPASSARPPGGGSWSELVASGEVTDTRPLWNRIMNIAWNVAKLRQFDSYVGNPDPTGAAATVFQYRLAAPEAAIPPPADLPSPRRATPMLQASALLALLLLAFDGVLLWSLL